MRFGTMLVLAGVLAAPGAAVAQDTDPLDPMDPTQRDPTQQEPTGPGTVEEGQDVRTGMEMGQPQVEIFRDKKNFEIRGTVSSVDAAQNRITVQREEGMPPVELQVAQGTEIRMDGKQSSLQELQAGSEVRATFNVAQDQPIAIQLDARKARGEKRQRGSMNR